MNDNDRSAAGRPGRSSPFPPISSSPFLSPSAASQYRNNNSTPPLHLTARFLSLPDVQIEIPDPSRVTVVGLKTLIRKQLVRAAAQADAEPPSPTSSTKPQRKDKEKEKEPSASSSPTLHDAHRRRLRIIYAGKILADDIVLGNVLKPVPPPPRTGRSPSVSTSAASTPVGNQSTNIGSAQWGGTDSPQSSSEAARVYVNCSIGDILPESELTAEADAAAVAAAMLTRSSGGSSAVSGTSGASTPGQRGGGGIRLDPTHRRGASGGGGVGAAAGAGAGAGGGSSVAGPSTPSTSRAGGSTTTPAPRGFERLLQAGFTSAEVNQLRLQFNTIQSSRFTPDTMPSPDSLRTMEDNWLDNNQGGTGSGGGANGATTSFGRAGAGGGGDDGIPPVEDTGLPGMLDIMVRAMVIGFMFPLGSMSWLMREEGLWTPRWRMFVSMGVVVSLMIGSVKTLAGEW